MTARLLTLGACCVAAAATLVPATAQGAAANDGTPPSRVVAAADVASGRVHPVFGDLVVDNGLHVGVPVAGEGLCAAMDVEADSVSGVQELCVETDAQGRVHVSGIENEAFTDLVADEALTFPEDDEFVTTAATADGTTECTDTTSTLHRWKWTSAIHWRYNRSTTPGNLTANNVEDDLRAAGSNWERDKFTSNCYGPFQNWRVNTVFDGATSRRADVDPSQRLGCPTNGQDNVSVVDFGSLPAGVRGITCTRKHNDNTAFATDVRLNKNIRWATRGEGCSGDRVYVEDVATHERGHSIGIAHPDQNPIAHQTQTMGSNFNSCSLSRTTLGIGDIRGVIRKYG